LSEGSSEVGQGAGVVDTRALTYVVVVFEAELELLRLQARSMATYLDPGDVHEILVIDNSTSGLGAGWRQRLLRDYGPLAGRVRLVPAAHVGRDASGPALKGWTSQQILKLGIATQVRTPWYVVLDAKNHLVAPTGRDAFVGEDGRAHLGWHPYVEHPLRAGVERTMRFAGLTPEEHLGHFPVTRTPFVMSTGFVRSMCAELVDGRDESFAELFTAEGLVEFPLYSASLIAGGEMSALHDEQSIPCPTIWPKLRTREGVERVLAGAAEPGVQVLAVHRTALARMSPGSIRALVAFWRSHGLFGSATAGHAFVWRFRWGYARSMAAREARRRLARG
jgi:uncharacterized protein DUF6492